MVTRSTKRLLRPQRGSWTNNKNEQSKEVFLTVRPVSLSLYVNCVAIRPSLCAVNTHQLICGTSDPWSTRLHRPRALTNPQPPLEPTITSAWLPSANSLGYAVLQRMTPSMYQWPPSASATYPVIYLIRLKWFVFQHQHCIPPCTDFSFALWLCLVNHSSNLGN